ncbi:sensor histidine kinase [Sulfurimonas paralvinellae]|uniref:histidine kinase n=1 Tax=Sulfurimonas paralvinellae TaxID=317658 RepID=A0A7M1BA22_9BACT|nr:HAMP domain-containing sensor histidine kinase [Sulfurimonas paralvinellae]QOP46570.1 HAMP domain-containing histidine kinase [Sulfurimonas paralvinellae]
MNELEKRSFYSFVGLYLLSSFLFVLFSGYWYYSAQKNSLESTTYYKMNHIADKLSGLIINAQMQGKTLHLPNEDGFEYMLIPSSETGAYKLGYYEKNGYKVLVSDAPQKHLNIKYVVVKTKRYFQQLKQLQKSVLMVMGVSFLLIMLISFILSKLFMKPVHQRMEQIESFIQDVSHELNTPITALKMSASRAIKKEVYDKNILTNISISTKQLESIYKSLTFLNFKQKEQEAEDVNLKDLLLQTLSYYSELTEAKDINIKTELEDVNMRIIPSRAELLFSNLLSNAIKYSMPQTTITIKMNADSFIIEDEGVGIDEKKLDEIFEMYKRQSDIAGGFGVGLNIVKQICDANGIKITVSSEIGKGTTFTLFFKSMK